ncbi:MAG: Rrf2 family transcriptional regulator [Parafilimonas sp.]
MFSKKCEYAIRALIFIAKKTKKEGVRTGVKEIAKGIDAPEQFVAKILHELTTHHLVQSLKGPTGGFYLDKKSFNTSLASVVQLIDGDDLFTGCALGLLNCSEKKPCPIHNEFKKIRKSIYDLLQHSRLGNLQEQLEYKMAYLKQ